MLSYAYGYGMTHLADLCHSSVTRTLSPGSHNTQDATDQVPKTDQKD